MARYTKTYSSPAQLVTLLQSRGLHVENVARTENYLRHIGYYRFSAYLYPLLTTPKENHVFKPGATFNQALDMYRFDRHLRLLMFNEIEKIEIAVRSAIVNITSRETRNPFWMTDPTCFYDINTFTKTKQLIDAELAKSREDFIEHFRNTYSDPYPPSWMLAEILPLGVLTRIYVDDDYHCCQKQLRSSRSRMEPYICSEGFDSATYGASLDRNSSQPKESLFQSLYH